MGTSWGHWGWWGRGQGDPGGERQGGSGGSLSPPWGHLGGGGDVAKVIRVENMKVVTHGDISGVVGTWPG